MTVEPRKRQHSTSTAREAYRNACQQPSVLFHVTVQSKNVADTLYLFIWDAVQLPPAGSPPNYPPLAVPPESDRAADFSYGRQMDRGIVVALSTTQDTFTKASAADGWFDVVYAYQ